MFKEFIKLKLQYSQEEKKSALLTLIICILLAMILFGVKILSLNTSDYLSGGGGGGGNGVAISLENTNIPPLGQTQKTASKPLEENRVVALPVHKETEDIVSYKKDIIDNTDVVIHKSQKKEEKKTPVKKQEVVTTANSKPKQDELSGIAKDALSSLLNSKTGSEEGMSGGGGLSASDGYYGTGSGSGTGQGSGNGSGTGSGSGSGSGGGSGSGIGNGVGDGIGYSLDGRSALVKPVPKYNCNETGTVVVEVWVNREGKTIEARAGVKGTTNTASCLIQQAKEAALQTKWQPSAQAPEKQIGHIVYQFKLR